MSNIKAVLFDLDGTILDSEKVYMRFWMESARQQGYPLEWDTALRLRSCDSSVAKDIIETATGIPGSYAKIRALRRQFMTEFLKDNDLEIKPGAIEFLNRIRPLPVRKAIVTTSAPYEKLPMLRKYGIADYFDQIVSVKDVKRGKPFPDIYLFACSQLGLSPQECVAIEDSPNGVKSAYEAGIHVIMVPDLSEPDEEIAFMCKTAPRMDLIPDDFFMD